MTFSNDDAYDHGDPKTASWVDDLEDRTEQWREGNR